MNFSFLIFASVSGLNKNYDKCIYYTIVTNRALFLFDGKISRCLQFYA